jgi:hypothetical protein
VFYQACGSEDIRVCLADSLGPDILRTRFGCTTELDCVKIQRQYCEQWLSNSLCHAKAPSSCADTIARMCRPMILMLGPMDGDQYKLLHTHLQQVLHFVEPPKLTLDKVEMDALNVITDMMSDEVKAEGSFLAVFHKFPVMTKTFKATLQSSMNDLLEGHKFVGRVQAFVAKYDGSGGVDLLMTKTFGEAIDDIDKDICFYYNVVHIAALFREAHVKLDETFNGKAKVVMDCLSKLAVRSWKTLMADLVGADSIPHAERGKVASDFERFVFLSDLAGGSSMAPAVGTPESEHGMRPSMYMAWARHHVQGNFKTAALKKPSSIGLAQQMMLLCEKLVSSTVFSEDSPELTWCKATAMPELMGTLGAHCKNYWDCVDISMKAGEQLLLAVLKLPADGKPEAPVEEPFRAAVKEVFSRPILQARAWSVLGSLWMSADGLGLTSPTMPMHCVYCGHIVPQCLSANLLLDVRVPLSSGEFLIILDIFPIPRGRSFNQASAKHFLFRDDR